MPPTHRDAAHRAPPQVLVVTDDPVLTDDVLRLGAAVGVSVTVAPDALAAAPVWQLAELVLVDAYSVSAIRTLGLPRRSRAVLAADPPVAADVWQDAVAVGITAVVSLPAGEGWLVDAFAEASTRLATLAPIATVVGARGGAGASVLAVALASVAAAEGLASYLVDLDPLGCGAHVMLGLDHLPGSGWDDLDDTAGRVPPSALRAGLPTVAGVKLLGWPGAGEDPPRTAVAPGVAGAAIDAAARDGDVVIVDVPRWACFGESDHGSFALEALTRSSRVILVASADVRSALAGKRLLAQDALRGLAVGLVVRGPSPGGITASDVAGALEVPLLAFVPHERGLDRLLEDGFPPGSKRGSPLRACARTLLAGLAEARSGGGG